MLSILDLIVLAFGAALVIVWLVFYFRGRRFEELFLGLDDEDYPAKELYVVGYAVIDTFGLQFKGKSDRKLRKDIEVLYGSKFVEYYIRVIYSQKITMALTVMCFAAPMYFATGEWILAVAMIGLGGFVFYYYGNVIPQKIQQRSDELVSEFSDVVSKLALLVNAGMILREAWEKIAYTGNGCLYGEMQRSVIEMQNGTSEVDAIFAFGQRSMTPEIKKFSSTLIQGLTKGNSELAQMLTAQSKEVWNLKMQYVRRQGELANNKLLIPIFMVFAGILIVVIVPIFANLGV